MRLRALLKGQQFQKMLLNPRVEEKKILKEKKWKYMKN